jgi:hypothetical protein
MTQKTVGLYFSSFWDNIAALPPGGGLLKRYRKALRHKANPRTEAYMHALLAETFPGASFVNVAAGPDWHEAARQADVIVLLYPDATGIGFSAVERQASCLMSPWAERRVLNGRRRDFLLNGPTRWSLRLRRWLEISMLGEFAFLGLFLVVTPGLLAIDWARGRR